MADSPTTKACMNWGRLVADCGFDDCTNAMTVVPGQALFVCQAHRMEGACGRTSVLVWEVGAAEMASFVADRPPSQRTWHPDRDAKPVRPDEGEAR